MTDTITQILAKQGFGVGPNIDDPKWDKDELMVVDKDGDEFLITITPLPPLKDRLE